jgi:hypothetical protein
VGRNRKRGDEGLRKEREGLNGEYQNHGEVESSWTYRVLDLKFAHANVGRSG